MIKMTFHSSGQNNINFLKLKDLTVGGNVNWCSHYGKQYGGSSKD